VSRASAAPKSAPRLKQVERATVPHPHPGAPPEWNTLPEVGLTPHDLRFFAVMFARQFGMTANNCSAAELMGAAISQTCFDIDAVAEALGEEHDHYHVLLGIKERLHAAAESADIVSMLLHNVRANT
jgi:hypothetical protein